jgi:hypothetical protein
MRLGERALPAIRRPQSTSENFFEIRGLQASSNAYIIASIEGEGGQKPQRFQRDRMKYSNLGLYRQEVAV